MSADTQLYLPLPLLNTYSEVGWALALRLCWAKDSMHKLGAGFKTFALVLMLCACAMYGTLLFPLKTKILLTCILV